MPVVCAWTGAALDASTTAGADTANAARPGSHTFRRTVATMLDDAGGGIGAIATVLGQDPVTTSGYIKTAHVGDAAALTLDTAF